jgi:hypothetical protein
MYVFLNIRILLYIQLKFILKTCSNLLMRSICLGIGVQVEVTDCPVGLPINNRVCGTLAAEKGTKP